MKAMIFAAGIGSRLKPLTDYKPKALVEIEGKPLLYYALKKLISAGCSDIIINVHHFSHQIIEYLNEWNDSEVSIRISDESHLLLDTGGGLKNASYFFDDGKPFFVYNVDVVSDIDLKKMMDSHVSNACLATLAVMKRSTSRYLLFDEQLCLCGWRNKQTNLDKISRVNANYREMAFSGIQIIDPRIFSAYTNHNEVFPIMDMYLELAKKEIIHGFDHSDSLWFDLGKFNELDRAVEIVKSIEKL